MADLSNGSTVGGQPIMKRDSYHQHDHQIVDILGAGTSAQYNITDDFSTNSSQLVMSTKGANQIYDLGKFSNQVPGGFTNHVLRKKSNADGDVEWFDPAEGLNIVVNAVHENQILSSTQTIVDLNDINTTGLAVYIEGVRLSPDIHYTVLSNTRIQLSNTYPQSTIISMYNNDPYADVSATENVLGLTYRPVGEVSSFARQTPPTGWLHCNGQAVSRTTYSDLFNAIGTVFGAGNGTTTFNVPDLRGEFIRGWDNGRGIDSGRGFGTWQGDELRSHTHSYQHYHDSGNVDEYATDTGDDVGQMRNYTTGATGGSETRPRNVALMYCIRY